MDPNYEGVLRRLKPLIEEQSHSGTFYLECFEGFQEFIDNKPVAGIDAKYFAGINVMAPSPNILTLPERPPKIGELVQVRSRRWLVEESCRVINRVTPLW